MTGNASIHEKLGGLLEGMKAVQKDISDIKLEMNRADERAVESYERSEARAAASRGRMYAKTDELVDRLGKTETSLKALTKEVADVKAVTDDVTRWKLMGMGALGITGLAAGAIGSALTYFWSDLLRLLRG